MVTGPGFGTLTPASASLDGLLTATPPIIRVPDLEAAIEHGQIPAPRPLGTGEVTLALHQDEVGRERLAAYQLHADYYEGRQRDPRALTFGDTDAALARHFRGVHNLCGP